MIHTSTSLTKLAVRIGAAGILSATFAAVGAGAAEMRAPKGPIEITVGTCRERRKNKCQCKNRE